MSNATAIARRTVSILVICVGIVAGLWGTLTLTRWLADRPVRAFHTEADTLIQGLHQYKELVGSYPPGENADIARALAGENPRKVIILAVRDGHFNAHGEIIDPWGTPLKIYFADRKVLIRSAGPNRRWEDSRVKAGDDFYRAE